ncbi:MAG: class I SAM-dependent methyltransferase [Sphingobium sp.]
MNGVKALDALEEEASVIFSPSLKGKRVLDMGAWDGFFSFEAERRGAQEVLATDHFCWSGPGWGDKRGFDHAHARFGSRVMSQDIDISDHSPQTLGMFDLVLLLGVLYHVTDPYRTLEAAAAMSRDQIVVETVTAMRHESLPAMRLFQPLELDKDPTNFWAPNIPALRQMLSRFGFSEFRVTPGSLDDRGWRKWARPFRRQDHYRRAIIHARR